MEQTLYKLTDAQGQTHGGGTSIMPNGARALRTRRRGRPMARSARRPGSMPMSIRSWRCC